MAGYVPPPCGPYQYNDVLSALRKEIKLGNEEDAIYWANVILTYVGSSAPGRLAKNLWIMAAEDLYDPAIVLRAGIVFQNIKAVPETDHLFYLIAEMCRAPGWWETPEGRETNRLWSKAIGDLKDPERRKPVPSYALDRHTRRGWRIFQETGRFDDRYTGTGYGQQKTQYLFMRDGRLDPAINVLDDNDPDWLAHWRQRVKLEGYRPGYQARDGGGGDHEPNDPLGAEGEDLPLFGDSEVDTRDWDPEID